jgi:hypothetical protein
MFQSPSHELELGCNDMSTITNSLLGLPGILHHIHEGRKLCPVILKAKYIRSRDGCAYCNLAWNMIRRDSCQGKNHSIGKFQGPGSRSKELVQLF